MHEYFPAVANDGETVICCGKGNNAGDGFALARLLLQSGPTPVRVLLFADPGELSGDALANYQILQQTDAAVEVCRGSITPGQLAGARSIVDALLGTGARGAPRAPLGAVIDAINDSGAPVLAVDVPSGLDCDTGEAAGSAIRAAHTVTFVAAKPGLLVPTAQPYVGQLHIKPIGAPRKIIEAVCVEIGKSEI
jgi:NAD(P)H-hydrate epimerase